jgi:hypothetical protein
MPTVATNPIEVERVLLEATSLLLERARVQLEREIDTGGESVTDDAATNLLRMRELENTLQTIRQERSRARQAVPEPVPGRQVSKFYEVPGQEDA